MQTVNTQSPSQPPIQAFRELFGHAPQYVVTSPGRVNLIGEHTDYNLLPVLPMCIDRAITLHISPRTDAHVHLINTNPAYTPFELNLDEPITPNPGHWANYCLAALHHLIPHLRATGRAPRGFNALVSSTLPPAAGLSSSSALVIGTCLAFLQVNDIQWTPLQVAEEMRDAEQFVGTAGGGMDQAAIALGQPDSALLIEFDPLHATPVPIPEDITIFIIHSGQKAEKSGAARYNYNRRALECAIGVELLNQHLAKLSPLSQTRNLEQTLPGSAQPATTDSLNNQASTLEHASTGSAGIPAGPNANRTTSLEPHTSPNTTTPTLSGPNRPSSLRDIYNLTTSPTYTSHRSHRSYSSPTASTTPTSPSSHCEAASSSHVREAHPSHLLTAQQQALLTPRSGFSHLLTFLLSNTAVSAAAITPDQLKSLITPERFAHLCRAKKLDPDATSEWLPNNLLQIYPRVAHVLNEADRVYALRDAFARNDRTSAFHISNAGHASCRDLYHISTPEIETLIQKTLAAGAGSARITGAGFGGCIVALVPTENAHTFPQNLITAGIPPENIIKAQSQGPARLTPAG